MTQEQTVDLKLVNGGYRPVNAVVYGNLRGASVS